MDKARVQEALRGRYRLEEELGRGGMGVVYQAYQDSQQRRVALKLVGGGFADDPDWRARVAHEAKLAARVSHPNVVRIFELDDDPARGWMMIALELVVGESLRALLERESPLDAARVRSIGSAVAAGLDAIHAAGVLHRDMKPENVMLSEHGPKITDLGIAKELGGDQIRTRTGVILGTPPYMSPEQVLGEPMTAASDVYAMGCMLYEMATGRLPFDFPQVTQILAAHVNVEPAPPSSVRGGLPGELSDLIMRAMAKEPRRRPTASDLAALLAVNEEAGEVVHDAPTAADGVTAAPAQRPSARGTVPIARLSEDASSPTARARETGARARSKPERSQPVSRDPASGAVPAPRPEHPARRGWGWRLAVLAGGAALGVATWLGLAAGPRGRLELPAPSLATAAAGFARARAAGPAAATAALAALLADPRSGEVRQLVQAEAEQREGVRERSRDVVVSFFDKVERAAQIRDHLLRVEEACRVVAARFTPAELGLEGVRRVTDGLVLRVEFERGWARLVDDSSMADVVLDRGEKARLRFRKMHKGAPPRLQPDVRHMRNAVFRQEAPPDVEAFESLLSELALAAQQAPDSLEVYRTALRWFTLNLNVLDVESEDKDNAPAIARLEAAAPPGSTLARALVAGYRYSRPHGRSYPDGALHYRDVLEDATPATVVPAVWAQIPEVAACVAFPWVGTPAR